MTSFQGLLLCSFLFLQLISCTSEAEKKKEVVHDFYLDFQSEAKVLNKTGARVHKYLQDNGNSDSLVETPNWEKEFQLFIESDINYRPLSDQFKLETLYAKDTLIKQLTRINSDAGVQLIKHYFLQNSLEKVLVLVENRDLLRSSGYILTYFPKQSYSIQARVSIPLLLNREITVKGKILP